MSRATSSDQRSVYIARIKPGTVALRLFFYGVSTRRRMLRKERMCDLGSWNSALTRRGLVFFLHFSAVHLGNVCWACESGCRSQKGVSVSCAPRLPVRGRASGWTPALENHFFPYQATSLLLDLPDPFFLSLEILTSFHKLQDIITWRNKQIILLNDFHNQIS